MKMSNSDAANVNPLPDASTDKLINQPIQEPPPSNDSEFLNPGTVTLPLAPYLFVSITGSPDWELNREGLHKYLKTVASGKNTAERSEAEWLVFAQENHLMAADFPLTRPDLWFRGGKRWITVTWKSDWEVHLHFGFVNTPGEKHTHIQLAIDTKHWLSKLAGKAKRWWQMSTPTVAGEARIASYDTGIQILPRQSFIKTLKSKDSATAAAGICVPCIGFLVKNYEPGGSLKLMGIYVLGAVVLLLASTAFTAVIRHFFALPRFSWAVAQLKD